MRQLYMSTVCRKLKKTIHAPLWAFLVLPACPNITRLPLMMSAVSGAVDWPNNSVQGRQGMQAITHAPPAQQHCSPEHYTQPVGAKSRKTDTEVLQYSDSPVWFCCIGKVISGTLCRVTGWLQQSSLAVVYHVTFGRVLSREKTTPTRWNIPKARAK